MEVSHKKTLEQSGKSPHVAVPAGSAVLHYTPLHWKCIDHISLN